jgi:hypothetical protein
VVVLITPLVVPTANTGIVICGNSPITIATAKIKDKIFFPFAFDVFVFFLLYVLFIVTLNT